MSNYYYKGISISTITNTAGASSNAPGYNNFPVAPTNQYQQPSPLGYTYSSNQAQVSTLCTAVSANFTSGNTTITAPAGVKGINALILGGGGGGGGSGGNASAKENGSPKSQNAFAYGGPGSLGGYGNYYSLAYLGISDGTSITINVGGGGAGGAAGPDDSANTVNGGATANGGPASPGVAGGISTITIGNTSWSSSATNGGGGGNGGSANANANTGRKSTPGNANQVGTPDSQTNTISGWDTFDGTVYGLPGNGGNAAATGPGTAGTGGAVKIIWLYG